LIGCLFEVSKPMAQNLLYYNTRIVAGGVNLNYGKILNIQKYSIHDGPGIRTTVFFKGCPLKCIWCHNPESQSFDNELLLYNKRCIGCKDCVETCKYGAIGFENGGIKFNRDKCISCGSCTEKCYAKARELAGKAMTAEEVIDQIKKDSIFYDESGGGVTFSGGEPLSQPDFLLELLEQCKKNEYHTAIDTCGYGATEIVTAASRMADLFLYDLKSMDDEKHVRYTGVSNKLILENLNAISRLGSRIFIRIPLMPGINDDKVNIKATAEVIKNTSGIDQVNILPYHNIASDKYTRLGRQNGSVDIPVPSEEHIESIKKEFLDCGIKVKIGG
jgi:pyruvate formate lyase activating enzyme